MRPPIGSRFCAGPVEPELIGLGRLFSKLGKQLRRGLGDPIEHVRPGASAAELDTLEAQLGVALPPSYRAFLKCTRGLCLFGGGVQMSNVHPFFHEFEPLASLNPAQQSAVRARGGMWPPPSDGMLCFAEFSMEADGDQVLFDVTRRAADGECPVMYYAHETSPPSVRELAPTFRAWLEQFLEYPEFCVED